MKRQQEGKVKPLGYEDEPKGGIPLPSASFGVGGEFGVGGKYDNGQRFDLRLPYVDQGWVDESSTLRRKSYTKKKKSPLPRSALHSRSPARRTARVRTTPPA